MTKAYERITEPDVLGVLLDYPPLPQELPRRVEHRHHQSQSSDGVVGLIGAGNFANFVILPLLKDANVNLGTVASSNGGSASLAEEKLGFQSSTSNYQQVFDDTRINTVFITTRHNSLAQLVREAIEAGKHVFVEKPLTLTSEDLESIEATLSKHQNQQLMVGFNRRFSPLAVDLRTILQNRLEPCHIVYTVNAGALPLNHWTLEPVIGGGRIIGEGCHFIDIMRSLIAHPIIGVESRMLGALGGQRSGEDCMSITLEFADESIVVLHYLANGSKAFPKERVEVFHAGRVFVIDNFHSLRGYEHPKTKKRRTLRQQKGHAEEIQLFVSRVQNGGEWLIGWEGLKRSHWQLSRQWSVREVVGIHSWVNA